MDLDVLKVKFTHSNTVRDKRPYTIYEIEVRSSSTITWVIYKRYSHFHALHELLKAQSTDPELKDVRLPILPPKRLTRSLAVDFVERRKNELQEYLRAILDQPVLVHSPMMLDFLEVPDSVRPMLTSEGPTRTLYPGLDLSSADPKVLAEARTNATAAYSHKSFEERRILELINLLKYHPNKVAAVKSFEEYFFESKPRFTHEFIRLLLQGKSGSDGEGGLVQTCGDFAYSHVACRAALYLLCRLLDVEKNKDAQLFLDQFTSLDVSVLKKMQLHLHILSERGNRLGAFRIVSILRNHYGQAGGNMMQGEATVELIVADTWARKEYFRWAERSGTEQAGTMTYGHEPTPLLGPLSLSEMGYRPVAQQTFADVLRTAQDESGWRIVGSIPATSGNGKQIAPAPVSINDEVSIAYKKDVFKDMVIVRVSAIFPYRPEQLIKILSDLRVRSTWDLKFHKGKLLQSLDKDSDVVQLVFKSFSSPYKYRDFILLRSQSRLDNGGYLLTARSVVHASGVDNKDHVRAVSFPTGYILTPLQGQISDLRAPDKAPTSAELTPGLATSAASATPGAAGGIGAGARGAAAATNVAGSSSSVVSRFQSPSIAVASTAAAGVGSAASSALHFTVRKTVVGNSPFGGGAAVSTPGKPPMPGAPSPPPPPATPPPPPSSSSSNSGVGTTTDACMLTFIAQLDREGILILSPDLLGESTELRDSINLIKQQLMKEIGPRSLRPSIHTASITAANKMVNNNSLASGMGSGMKFAVSGGDEEDFQTPRSTLSLGGVGTTDGLGAYSVATPRA